VSGFCVPGSFDLLMEWSSKTIKILSIIALESRQTTLYYCNDKKEIAPKKGRLRSGNGRK